ncbi:hypothetical protein, partial [Heyndrickxia sporothermodurans]
LLLIFPYLILAGTSVGLSPLHLPESYLCGNFIRAFFSSSSRILSLRELQLGFLLFIFPNPIFAGTSVGLFLLIFSYPILAGTSFGPSSLHLPVSYSCGNFIRAFFSSSSRILSLRELHSGFLFIFP